jgi:hypothetical protein
MRQHAAIAPSWHACCVARINRRVPKCVTASCQKRFSSGSSSCVNGVGMRFRRWIGRLAVAVVLLHAATVARHNVIQFNAIAAELASPASFEPGAICHVDSGTDTGAKAQTLPGENREHGPKPCPICLGFASAHALSAGEAVSLPAPRAVLIAVSIPEEPTLEPAGRFSFPLSRGPPSLA